MPVTEHIAYSAGNRRGRGREGSGARKKRASEESNRCKSPSLHAQHSSYSFCARIQILFLAPATQASEHLDSWSNIAFNVGRDVSIPT